MQMVAKSQVAVSNQPIQGSNAVGTRFVTSGFWGATQPVLFRRQKFLGTEGWHQNTCLEPKVGKHDWKRKPLKMEKGNAI